MKSKFFSKVGCQRLAGKLKEGEKFLTSPDVTKYPVVLGFRTKDICEQRENDLKNTRSLATKKSRNGLC